MNYNSNVLTAAELEKFTKLYDEFTLMFGEDDRSYYSEETDEDDFDYFAD